MDRVDGSTGLVGLISGSAIPCAHLPEFTLPSSHGGQWQMFVEHAVHGLLGHVPRKHRTSNVQSVLSSFEENVILLIYAIFIQSPCNTCNIHTNSAHDMQYTHAIHASHAMLKNQ